MTTKPDPRATTRPGDRWRQALAAREVPQDIVDNAPEPAPSLDPERFRWRPDEDASRPVRPSRRRALEALPDEGSVRDVGVGGGASSLGLIPRAGSIPGVDPMPDMLALFEASGRDAGMSTRTVLGAWPEVADQVEPVDVAVCHHAMYGVVEIEEFVHAMTARAYHRVVLELSAQFPQARFDPLWGVLHASNGRRGRSWTKPIPFSSPWVWPSSARNSSFPRPPWR